MADETTGYKEYASKQYVDERCGRGDWNQNDETAASYIQNRPFYIGEEAEEVLLPETSITTSEEGMAMLPTAVVYEAGKTYTVTLNGTVYNCVAQSVSGGVVISNDDNSFQSFSNGSVTQVILSTVGDYTISISGMTADIHKIDSKFLPSGANVGEIDSGYCAEIFNSYEDGIEGEYRNIASGRYSHAEGMSTQANGDYSHAEGKSTQANGDYSHAEGSSAYADADCSHAEGRSTAVYADYGHAEGYCTIASSPSQHVQGEYNIEDAANTYAHIVGNGSSTARSNAHTLDWDGNAWFAGSLYLGGTGQSDANVMADYIVAQGTSGDWTYAKYNSGRAVMSCKIDLSNFAISNTFGGFSKSGIQKVSLPFSLASTDGCVVDASILSSGTVFPVGCAYTVDQVAYYLVSSAQTFTGTIELKVEGRWA